MDLPRHLPLDLNADLKPLHAPAVLLHLLMFALLTCILAGAVLYAYWSLMNVVSEHRRQMNAAAYRAQLYFDQKELLLRSTAAASLRNLNRASPMETPRTIGNTNQVEVLPLCEQNGDYDWALALTPRALWDLRLAKVQLVYSSVRTFFTYLVLPGAVQQATLGLSANSQRWLSLSLAAAEHVLRSDGSVPIVWFKPPEDPQGRLFMYTPMDIEDASAGWLGLALEDVASMLAPPEGEGGYVLVNSISRAVLHGQDMPDLEQLPVLLQEDVFGFAGSGVLPEYLILSKSVGDDGWRLVYYIRLSKVLMDTLHGQYGALVCMLLAGILVLLGMRRVHRTLVAPAVAQYVALVDSLQLNRMLLDLAPVGLALCRQDDGGVLLANGIADRWIRSDPDWCRRVVAEAGDATQGIELDTVGGVSMYLSCAPTVYQGHAVVLYGFSDISALKRVERALLQAKSEAEAANQAKTLFLTTLSHEIRTPLYGVLGTLELLSTTRLGPQQLQYLEIVQQSSEILLRTVNDTLDLSRIEAGHLQLENVPFCLIGVLDQVVASYAARAQEKHLRLYAVAETGGPACLLGDATRIRQVLANLVSNAIKFTESGQVVVRLHVLRVTEAWVDLRFQVVDTGVGIAHEHQDHLFEPYYQVMREQGERGTGLGLSICARLAQMMSGRLQAVSEPGLGTCVTFELGLPVVQSDACREQPVLLPQPVYVRGETPEVVDNLCRWLRHWGALAMPYRACSGQQGGVGVLVEAWPHAGEWVSWPGARVVVCPPGVGWGHAREQSVRYAGAFNLFEIGEVVRQIQEGAGAQPGRELLRDDLGLRVLVVDDNPINQLILRDQLVHLGCDAVVEPGATTALGRTDALAFDVILTDIHMPLVSGYELARELRARGYLGPVFGLTANAFGEEQSVRKMSHGSLTGMLLKPVSLQALYEILLKIREGRNDYDS